MEKIEMPTLWNMSVNISRRVGKQIERFWGIKLSNIEKVVLRKITIDNLRYPLKIEHGFYYYGLEPDYEIKIRFEEEYFGLPYDITFRRQLNKDKAFYNSIKRYVQIMQDKAHKL